MGVCCSGHDPNSKYIERKMKENEAYENSLHKLLFLGPGGSGKSTIFKQLQWLHGDGFSESDIMDLKQHINGQIISQMQEAIKYYLSSPPPPEQAEPEKLSDAINKVQQYGVISPLQIPADISESIVFIWQNDMRLKGIYSHHHSRQILDETTEFFWNNIAEISRDDYVPDRKDIINIRNRTTGIIEKKFKYKKIGFHIFDVGGQKSERKKWIKCFDNVSAIVFVISLSCYNQVMFEDESKNYMLDALQLFDKTVNDNHFQKTSIILFLNKTDLYMKKIKDLAITVCPAFDDFDPTQNPHDFEQTTRFIQQKFEERMDNSTRTVYTHLTCAMDDKNIQNVFDDIVQIIINQIKNAMTMQNIL